MNANSGYVAPQLRALGNIGQITRASCDGGDFDSNFQEDADIPFDEDGCPLIATF
jgi:hypothetical protein